MAKDNPNKIANGGQGTRVGKLLREIGRSDILEKAVNVVGSIASGNYLGAVQALISKDEKLTPASKEMLTKEIELDIAEAEQVTRRWESDMTSDSWLSKNVRPLTLIFLTLSLAIYIVLDSSIEGFTVKSEWVSLLSSLLLLVYGAYFGMRGLEKIQKIRNK